MQVIGYDCGGGRLSCAVQSSTGQTEVELTVSDGTKNGTEVYTVIAMQRR
jgi:hypothetical protein